MGAAGICSAAVWRPRRAAAALVDRLVGRPGGRGVSKKRRRPALHASRARRRASTPRPHTRPRQVIGYPTGGDNTSVTSGVVSRVEVTQYVHAASHLMAIQIDAASEDEGGGKGLISRFEACVHVCAFVCCVRVCACELVRLCPGLFRPR
jgi:hypothetical protein